MNLSIGGVELHGYGLMIGVAIILAWEWSKRRAQRWGVDERVFAQFGWVAVIAGVVGARVYHVVDYWDFYRQQPVLMMALWEGGLAIWGAVIGGAMGLVAAARITKKWNMLMPIMGAVALALPLAQAIGRIGNWLNGELYGLPTKLPWGIPVPDSVDTVGLAPNTLVHPLFWYEAILNGGLFLILNTSKRFTRDPWLALSGYLVGYGLIRLGLEPLRWQMWMIAGIPTASIFSGLAIVLGLMIGYKRRARRI